MRKECKLERRLRIDPEGAGFYTNEDNTRYITMTGVSWKRCKLEVRRSFEEGPPKCCALDWRAGKEMKQSGEIPGGSMLTSFVVYCLLCERLVSVGEMRVWDVITEADDIGTGDEEKNGKGWWSLVKKRCGFGTKG